VGIRPADVGDVAAIADVHVGSWQAAYAGLVPAEYLDGLKPVQRRGLWSRLLSEPTQTSTGTFVAEDETGVVGFVNVGSSRDEDASPAVGEVVAIYLMAGVWDAGWGRALMAAAVAALTAAGFAEATLWVLVGNTRARRFYEAGGWRADGATRTEERGGAPLPEVRYRRPLAPEPR
jgi:RimJ/RimL family protein N-acetyltransferase